MTNIQRARRVLAALLEVGCREFIVCAGARNAPLVKLLSQQRDYQVSYFPEERVGSFFALGRIKALEAPVAVVTTSGTAAAELLPASIEAFYSGLPLIVVTADRPPEYRGSGAPQAIDQVGLFGRYAEKSVDVWKDGFFTLGAWSQVKPIHINVCFDEPLIDEAVESESTSAPRSYSQSSVFATELAQLTRSQSMVLARWLARVQKPAMIIGPIPRGLRETFHRGLDTVSIPVYCEALSGLRQEVSPQAFVGESQLRGLIEQGQVDGLIRIGGVPTTRVWRDLESRFRDLPVLNISHLEFSGLARFGHDWLPAGAWRDVCSHLAHALGTRCARVTAALGPTTERASIDSVSVGRSLSEGQWFRALSEIIPEGSKVYLGNSLPVREWDEYALRGRRFDFEGNRGANGIDGQLSTFLGWADPEGENWAIIGDLTAFYDLQSLWGLSQRHLKKMRIVVINNGGGRIFSSMFRDAHFENRHDLRFQSWAQMFGIGYECWSQMPEQPLVLPDQVVIEILPNDGGR